LKFSIAPPGAFAKYGNVNNITQAADRKGLLDKTKYSIVDLI
jgi:hypothetical protein